MSRTSHETSNLPQGGERQRHAAAGEPGAGRLRAKSAAGADRAGTPPKVTVAKPTKRLLADHDEYVGRFVAVDAIEVRARVSGYLDAIHFQDGQLVKKGDLLFTIDRRPFEASLAQAEANLAQARANLAYAEADLERGQGLRARQHHYATDLRSAHAGQARRRGLRSEPRRRPCARPTSISSSPSCRRRSRDGSATGEFPPGNLVTGGTTGSTTLLATITSIDPIRFEFTMDETSYLRSRAARRRGASASAEPGGLAGQTQTDRRAQVFPRRQDGLRR